MTWTPKGSFLQTAFSGAGGTISLNNQVAGDVIFLVAISDSASNWVNSVSGGGCTWTQIGSVFTGSTNARSVTRWQGVVSATGAQTASLGITGGSPDIRAGAREWQSSVGSWALDGSVANLDSAGTSTWPSLTPAAAGDLYVGFSIDSSTATAGSTSGYTYDVTSQGNGFASNPNCPNSATAPVWGDSAQIFGSMFLVRETSSGTNANAGDATGTGAAANATPDVGAAAGDATGTGAALASSAGVGEEPGVASGTGAALGATASAGILVTAGLAGGTGAALAGVPGISVPGGVAGGDGAALGASASSSTPAGGLAAGSGTAFNATVTVPAAVSTGSWWGLSSVLKESRMEFDEYWSRPPLDCPVCGQPLLPAPGTAAASGVELFCNYGGDHHWQYPRDWRPPVRLDSGGLVSPLP